MYARTCHGFAGLRLNAAVMASATLLALSSATYAQCSGGGGGGGRGGSAGGVGTSGLVAAARGGIPSAAQSFRAAQAAQGNQVQLQGAAMMMVAGMQARQNAMLQQIHRRQYLQMLAMRQASQRKKREAGERVNVSYQSASRSSKSVKPNS